MVYGYIRVSTDKQTVQNQRFEIEAFCERNVLTIEKWIEETISGSKTPEKRLLGPLLDGVGPGDLIICSELSRLGRNLFMIMSILSKVMTLGARIWTIKDGYRLGDDIQSKVLAFAFGLSAEIERNLISQRTKEALARLKASGVKVGRPAGFAPRLKLTGYEAEIRSMIAQRLSKAEICRRFNVHRDTLNIFMAKYGLKTTKWIQTHRPKPPPDE